MRIAVISPHASGNGNTTLAMLLGLEFANSNKLTCLSHTKPTSPSFYRYLNFKGFVDKTSTPTQIVNILRQGTLSSEDTRVYCKSVAQDLEAFTNESSNFSQEDMDFMYKYIARAFPHENIIFDVDTDDISAIKHVIKECDVIVLNITQNVNELANFREIKDTILDIVKGKPLVTVINKFNSTKGSLQEVAKWAGIKKPNGWLVLHDNPWITWATNHGKLNELFRQIARKDPRVIELQADLLKICTTINKAKSAGDKKRRP